MKTYWILIFISLISVTRLFGQTENNEFAIAEELSASSRYASALPHYLNLLKHDSSNANVNFKIGICYLNSRSQKSKAVYFLNKAITPTTSCYTEGNKKQTNNPIIAYKSFGTCHLSYNIVQVNENCEKFKQTILGNKDDDLSKFDFVNSKMGTNKIRDEIKDYTVSSINLRIENIDKNHLSTFVDYTAVLSSGQTMIFTFQRPKCNAGEPNEENIFFEDIHPQIVQTENGKVIGRADKSGGSLGSTADTINNINKNEATIATSEDKQTILIYKDENGDGNLYISRLNENQWTSPEKVDKPINTKGWEPNECISADGNTLYFTSKQQGGFGGMDIYKSKKMPNGEWSKAVNLGPTINTPYDERAPFIHTDGVTLYFSSKGHKTIGTFDIYTSSLSERGSWSKPVNIGYPINKIQDGKAVNNKKNNVSPLSKKQIPMQVQASIVKETDNIDKENYLVTFLNLKKIPITLIKGNFFDLNGKVPKHIEIIIADNETGEIVGCYDSNSKKEKYSFILPPGRNNNITYQADGYLFHSVNFDFSNKNSWNEINKTVQMSPVAEGSKTVLNNIFFDSAKATVSAVSKVELNNIFQMLTMNPNLVVKISDYIISKENVKKNKKLSKERARAIEKYLIENGINKKNIIAKGYVKSKNRATKDKRNKNAPPFRNPLNQWVELKIVKIK